MLFQYVALFVLSDLLTVAVLAAADEAHVATTVSCGVRTAEVSIVKGGSISLGQALTLCLWFRDPGEAFLHVLEAFFHIVLHAVHGPLHVSERFEEARSLLILVFLGLRASIF